MLDEDFSVKIGHSDVVAVDDDQDLFETTPAVDLVADSGEG